MSIGSIRCAFPCSHEGQNEQTTASLCLRVAIIGIGALSFLTGILILSGTSPLASLGARGGWVCVGTGTLSLLLGSCLKGIKEEEPTRKDTAFPERVDQDSTIKKEEPKPPPLPQNPLSEKPVSPYSLETVINRIQEAKASGLQTALFLGRSNQQTMPSEKGWRWFSLDLEMHPENTDSHLRINFNHKDEMRLLHHLFDKVVVDLSVIKFFNDSPWDALQPLLFPHESSQLIVESDRGTFPIGDSLVIDARCAQMTKPFSSTLDFYKEEQKAFQAWAAQVGQTQAEHEYQKFLSMLSQEEIDHEIRMSNGSNKGLQLRFSRFILKREGLEPPRESHRKEFLTAISKYLETLFHHVELHNGFYPYRDQQIEADYWVATHPIVN